MCVHPSTNVSAKHAFVTIVLFEITAQMISTPRKIPALFHPPVHVLGAGEARINPTTLHRFSLWTQYCSEGVSVSGICIQPHADHFFCAGAGGGDTAPPFAAAASAAFFSAFFLAKSCVLTNLKRSTHCFLLLPGTAAEMDAHRSFLSMPIG